MEREEENRLSRSEMAALELKDYFKDCEFGDAKYQAFFDLQRIEELEFDSVDMLQGGKKLSLEDGSKLRYLENRRALLDQCIDQKKITIPDYWDAYISIWGKFEEYGVALYAESEKMNLPEKDRDSWADQEYNNTKDDIQTYLQEKLTWKKES